MKGEVFRPGCAKTGRQGPREKPSRPPAKRPAHRGRPDIGVALRTAAKLTPIAFRDGPKDDPARRSTTPHVKPEGP